MNKRIRKLFTLAAAISFIIAIIFATLNIVISDWLFALSLFFGGVPVAIAAFRNVLKRKLTISLLVTIAAIGALYLGQIAEAAAVMFFFALAEAFEQYGKNRSQKAIAALIEHSPKLARLSDDREVPVEKISINDVIKIRPGDLIPLDGTVFNGSSSVDESTITGESIPKEKYEGQNVYAGTLNQNGYLEVKVSKTSTGTTLAKIITLMQQAQKAKPEMQEFLDRFASFYIPTALGLAALVAIVPPLFLNGQFETWFTRALILLVLACPDALVVSAPVAVAAAIGGASRRGVIIKSGRSLETLSKIKAIAFDKTKTLTLGTPMIVEVKPVHGTTKEEVLADASGIEKFSSHPLASAIEAYAKDKGISAHSMTEYQNIPGRGGNAHCMVCETKEHAVGNLEHIGASVKVCEEVLAEIERMELLGMTTVIISEGPKVIGIIGITDQIRTDSKKVVTELQKLAITSIMLTGDNKRAANHVAKEIGITEVHGSLLPHQKAELIHSLQKRYQKVAMVGDGVNDAPSLARSDVGIAMGGSGSDVAIETADVALMKDDISTLPYLFKLGQKTFRVIKQNVYGSLIVKGGILVAGLFGLARLDVAVAIDATMALVVVLNGLRLYSIKTKD